MSVSPRRSREIDRAPSGSISSDLSCDRRRGFVEELLDRGPGREMGGRDAGDGELAEDRTPARAIALVEIDRRADDDRLRRDRRLTERASRPAPRAIERRGDGEAGRAPP